MGISKPFHRNHRAFIEGPNSGYSAWAYTVDKEYAVSPHHYTRAFLLIQEDLRKLFEYIEPGDKNMDTFSFRIYELLIRICIEVEANFKAILRENIYTPMFKSPNKNGQYRTEEFWNINDYMKINKTHLLSDYIVEYPIWKGSKSVCKPFESWNENKPLLWYQAYNEVKHNRNEKFELANFENLTTAFAGLFVLLSAQFNHQDFTPGATLLSVSSDSYFDGEFGIGDYLKIKFPTNWDEEDKYDFDWSILKNEANRFEKFDYNNM